MGPVISQPRLMSTHMLQTRDGRRYMRQHYVPNVLLEETECQTLAGVFDQERCDNQHRLRALEHRIEGLRQQLSEVVTREDGRTAPLAPRGEAEMVKTQREGAENRLQTDQADWLRESSREDRSRTWSQTESVARSPQLQDKEESEGAVPWAGQLTQVGLFGVTDSPPASAAAQGEKLQDSQISQESSAERNASTSRPAPRENRAVSRQSLGTSPHRDSLLLLTPLMTKMMSRKIGSLCP
uniref:uncharacterized protein n=1 Tax=Pristiophorus japonicus TaxID=55135 RepID=UPI00398EE040